MRLLSVALPLLALTILVSCSPLMYTSIGQNVPLFKEKGEVMLNAGYSSTLGHDRGLGVFGSDISEGVHFQAAVAVSNHISISSSFYSLKESGSEVEGSGNYIEVGIGQYKHWDKTNFIAEIFTGIGLGSIRNKIGTESVDINYTKPYIQPSIGYSNPYFSAAFTPRIALVTFTNHMNTLTDQGYHLLVENFFDTAGDKLVLEPGFTIRAGLKRVKFQYQWCYTSFSYSATNPNTGDEINPIDKFYNSFGLSFLITKKRRLSKN